MRLLVITIAFPPSRHANAKRPYYLVKGFLAAGWEVDIVTGSLGMENGAAETVAHPALRITRCKDPVEKLCRKFAGHPSLFRCVSLAINGLLWPDEFAFWSLRALRACGNATGYDRVLAFVKPASVLLSGLSSRWVGPRWIFDFQDSITPFFRQLPRRSPWQRMMVPVLRKLERHTLHQAGRVVFTSDTNRRTYIQDGLVAESATAHIPYFFDADTFRASAEAIPDRFQIVHLGTFDWRGARSPETFLRALARFLEKKPEARPRTHFLFHGNWFADHDRFIGELKLQDVVSINPAVSYDEYIRKLRQSPILLLVISSTHNLFMPSKIVDYFGAQRPILSFVPQGSEMRQVLDTAGMTEFACDEFDVAGGTAALERLWDRYQAGTLSGNADKTLFWSSEVQVPRYLNMVAQMDGAA
jgi:glycosyltransferase involved in cell wall biosynthesis